MSLATRCSSCGTSFRVVQDQLNVSEGWVRCGRCGAVFNAALELFDLDSAEARRRETTLSSADAARSDDAQPQAPAHDAGVALETLPADAEAIGTDPVDVDLSDDASPAEPQAATAHVEAASLEELLADPTDARLFRRRRQEDGRTPAVQVDARDRLEFSDARFDSDLFEDDAAGQDADALEVIATGAGDLPLESSSGQPDFLRRAEHRARWRARPSRAVLVGVVVLGTIAFCLQLANHFRDPIAARFPAAEPALAAWCDAFGCSLEAPRQVDAWAVESTALSRAIGIDAYLLAVTLKNRAAHAVAVPWIDLTLTDANGRLVAKRALSPADFNVARTSVAGAELSLQLAFDAGATRVAGYTVEIFHP